MLNETQVASTGFLETFKNAMQPEVIAHKIGVDKNLLIDIGLFGAIGFIIGFLLKKYSEYFIAAVFLIIGLIVLQQFEYLSISFNASKIHQMLGLPSTVIGDKYGFLILEWMKANVAGTVSCVIGFLIGLKVG